MNVNIDVKWARTLCHYYDLYLYVVLTYIYPIGVYKSLKYIMISIDIYFIFHILKEHFNYYNICRKCIVHLHGIFTTIL